MEDLQFNTHACLDTADFRVSRYFARSKYIILFRDFRESFYFISAPQQIRACSIACGLETSIKLKNGCQASE